MEKLASIILTAIVVLGVVSVTEAQAREPDRETYPPFYANKAKPYVAKVTIRLDSDCWTKVKVRFTDKTDPNGLINKQYFYNHRPGETGWVKIVTSMKFGVEKLPSGRMRGYAVVDDGFYSDYQFKEFTNTQYQKQGWIDWSFHLKTNKALCA